MKTMLTLLLFMMGCVVTPEVDSTSQEVRIGNPGDPDGCWTAGGKTCCEVNGTLECTSALAPASGSELVLDEEPAPSILPRCWFDDEVTACCSSSSGGQGSGYCFACFPDGSCVSGTVP